MGYALQLFVHDRSGHLRTATASARPQWALSDFNSKCQIAVGTTRPQPQVPGRSGALPDLSSKCQIAVCTPGCPSTASARSQWALPDLNGKRQIAVGPQQQAHTIGPQQQVPDCNEHVAVGTAGPQPQVPDRSICSGHSGPQQAPDRIDNPWEHATCLRSKRHTCSHKTVSFSRDLRNVRRWSVKHTGQRRQNE